MSFEDSMYDDGFTDSASYMNHLEKEAGRMSERPGPESSMIEPPYGHYDFAIKWSSTVIGENDHTNIKALSDVLDRILSGEDIDPLDIKLARDLSFKVLNALGGSLTKISNSLEKKANEIRYQLSKDDLRDLM